MKLDAPLLFSLLKSIIPCHNAVLPRVSTSGLSSSDIMQQANKTVDCRVNDVPLHFTGVKCCTESRQFVLCLFSDIREVAAAKTSLLQNKLRFRCPDLHQLAPACNSWGVKYTFEI